MTLDEAIEALGGLVSEAGGEGDDALDVVKDALERAERQDQVVGGVRSFLSSLPFQPPEALGFQVRVKLAGPLAELDRWAKS
jgi:hypothetical protein